MTAVASDGTNRNDGIRNNGTSSSGVPPTMNNVIARALGGTYTAGVSSLGSSPIMINVTASATGATWSNTGVHNGGQTALMINVTAFASGSAGDNTNNIGVSNFGSSRPCKTVPSPLKVEFATSGSIIQLLQALTL